MALDKIRDMDIIKRINILEQLSRLRNLDNRSISKIEIITGNIYGFYSLSENDGENSLSDIITRLK